MRGLDARAVRCALAALLLAACSYGGEPGLPSAAILAAQRAEYEAEAPKSIVELQPYRSESRANFVRSDGTPGSATLVNLNPYVNAWYLLSIEWPAGAGGIASYHLENTNPQQALKLKAADLHAVTVQSDQGLECALWADGRGALAAASASGLPYAPLCGGALYLRNPVTGHHTSLERITDFLRDHVWGGDRMVNFVKQEFYRDAFLEKGAASAAGGAVAAPTPVSLGPQAAALDPEYAAATTIPEGLALDLGTAARELQLGQWYAVRDLDGVFVSVIAPRYLAARYLGPEPNVNRLDATESDALEYLVAFDLKLLDLHFALGSDHPRLDWSERAPGSVRDPRLPGPDGVANAIPLVTNGMLSPLEVERTVATFAGGFKRAHGAFRVGALAERNHGSHYGFMQQGVLFSKLQPGLATAIVMDDGAVDVKTWLSSDQALMPNIRDARQNGVPLIEYEAQLGRSVPGELVDQWGAGNWSGSAEELLRTLRAGLCLQESGRQRFLIYGYFSSATPSAMSRVFQAYQCRYAMHLDMNALEHTYLALYVHRGGQLLVEHLVEGMQEVDRSAGKEFAPRFLAFPDDRDFFYLTRRAAGP